MMATWNQSGSPAPLVTFVSASGGVGKSTLALLTSWLAARAGIETTLLEGDLQFGDMGFWLGLDDGLSDLGEGAGASPIALRDGLSLYKAPCFPEVAEEVTEEVVRLVPKLRGKAELVVADTGQFWSGLTADLVCSSDLVLVVVDPRPSSIVGAVKARELLGRLGVPASRCACVYNRWSNRARLNAKEVAQGTGLELVMRVPDGKDDVETLVSTGEVEELVETGSSAVQGVDRLLVETLPRLGRVYAGGIGRRRGGVFR